MPRIEPKDVLREISADEWDRPIMDSVAAQWALDRIEELESLVRSQAERIAAQSELLSKRAVKPLAKPVFHEEG